MEPKRFIGNDMTRLYKKVRREFGPDAVIVRTRTLLREGADPLIEILAAPPEAEQDLALDLQWTMVDGALGRLQIARPRATVGDLEDMVARDALPPARLPQLGPAPAPEWFEGFVGQAPPAAHHEPPFVAEEQIVRRRPFPAPAPLPADVPVPAGWSPRPRPAPPEWRPAAPVEPAALYRGQDGVAPALAAAGLSSRAAQVVARAVPGEHDPAAALAHFLHHLAVRYPEEDMRAVITMQGPAGACRTTALLRMALDCADAGRTAVLVAADTSRAAAREQVMHYGEATGLPVFDAADAGEIVQAVMKSRPGACVFVDVPAGPFELPSMLGVAHCAYLALPGHWQAEALQRAVAGIPAAGLAGCVLTHTDLSTDLSPAVSLVVEAGVGIAFLSSGRDISTGVLPADTAAIASGILPMSTGETANARLVATA